MLPAVLMLLEWSASEPEVVVYTPVAHYHTLEGPSKQLRQITGPPEVLHTLEGPSQRLRILKGSN